MELVPAKVQKVSVVGDTVVVEVFAGAKRFFVFDPGRFSVVDDKPAVLVDRDDPPAVQGLLRKELQPAILTRIEAPSSSSPRYVFARKDRDEATLVLEVDGKDPRWLLVTPVKEGERILASGPATRAKDGRDLRRGRLYAPPTQPASPVAVVDAARAPPKTTPTTDPATQQLKARLKSELDRKRRLVKALENDLRKHGDPAALEAQGELLKTLMGKIPRGTARYDVVGFDGAPVTLALDPKKDSRQNLAALFARAKKAKTAIEMTRPRLDDARAAVAALEDARAVVDDPAAQPRVAALLASGGPSARRRAAIATAKAGGRRSWRSFAVAGGVVVKVGRGAKDNDALVKASNGHDLWLHARDATGAHVVIGSHGGPVADDVVRDAALLAAWFSTQRGERTVTIQQTRVKHLKKPGAGSPAGLWLVANETVFALRVDDDRVRTLLAAEVAG